MLLLFRCLQGNSERKKKNERVVGLITIFPYGTYKLIILTIRAVQWYFMHAYIWTPVVYYPNRTHGKDGCNVSVNHDPFWIITMSFWNSSDIDFSCIFHVNLWPTLKVSLSQNQFSTINLKTTFSHWLSIRFLYRSWISSERTEVEH